MLEKLSGKKTFKKMMKQHALQVLQYLLDEEVHFSIICNIEKISFSPSLPVEITASLKQFSVFVLAGYTFESAYIDEHHLYFEAGFGADNIGSNVTVPIDSILNIVVDENMIYINPAATMKNESGDEGVERSLSLLLSNPKNKHFIKK